MNAALPSGTRLGRYEIRSLLGAGGMGEVYRARDPKINRDVAIKVLPASLSADVERLRRFEQEAQAAGALNHPNILVIYDVDTHDDGAPYVVSELLEGETLRERLGGAPLPQRKAVEYALQIAHGLAAAHQKGIVHRDLKPENLFITKDGHVKILDFGLAKLIEPADTSAAQTDVPTRKVNTGAGVVLGTIGYMSPEQVRGQPADHRADIFSFGAVLYEMLSGRRAFRGDSAIETLNAILKEEPPDLTAVNSQVAPGLERVAQHCLEKRPEQRFQSASDVAFALEALTGNSGSTQVSAIKDLKRLTARERIAWLTAGVLLLAIASLAFLYGRRSPVDASVLRFFVSPPEKTVFTFHDVIYSTAVSPDGRLLAFVPLAAGQTQLWVRPLDSLNAQPLEGTTGATSPFWSPDSRFIGFFAEGKLKKIGATGGPPQTLCSAPPEVNSGTWNREDTILFTSGQGDRGILRVSASGGEPTTISRIDKSKGEIYQFWPYFLPDGKHFLYLAGHAQRETSTLCVMSLEGGETRPLIQTPSRVVYASPEYLLYVREKNLLAQPFDAAALRLTGEPIPVAERLLYFNPTGWAEISVSDNGVLAYHTGQFVSRLVWLNRKGEEIGSISSPNAYEAPRLSPDGRKLAVSVADSRTGANDIWIYDLTRGTSTRFTFDNTTENGPVWSPNGQRLAFTADRGDAPFLHQKMLSDSGSGEPLVKPAGGLQSACDYSADGQFIIYKDFDPKTLADLFILSKTGERKPFLQTPFNESSARFSPDGRFVAYVSDESGKAEVYVRFFEGSGEKWQISNTGGESPVWNRNGKELFYIGADNKLMSVPLKTDKTFEAGTPNALFAIESREKDYDVAPDGERFLFNSLTGTPPLPITVVVNWTAELKR
ncbi:MAG: protein kinase [Pyrinomonadaceae bacterium]